MKFSSTSLYYWEADVKPSELKQTWHVSFAFCLWSAQSLTQSHACFYLLKEAKGSECGHLRLAGFAFGILCQIFKMYIYGENIGFIMSESRLSWFFLAVCSYFTAQKYLDPVFHVNRLIFFGLGFGAFCSLLPIYLGYILRAAICKEIEYFQVILSSGYIVAVFLLAGVIRMFLSSTTHGMKWSNILSCSKKSMPL